VDQPKSSIVRDNIMILLDVAIKNLDTITKIAEKKIPSLLNVDTEGNHLIPAKKKHSLLYLLSHRERYEQKRREIRQILFSSIEVLKKHYRLLQKMKRGTEQELQWARHALDSINQYNALLIRYRKPPKTILDKLSRLFYTHTGLLLIDPALKKVLIEIPSEIFVRFDSLGDQEDRALEQIATDLKKGELVEFSKTERDIFYMRGITLAKESKLPSKLDLDITNLMQSTPITATEIEGETSSSVISMVQMMTPFPGEVVTLEGQFRRDESSQVPSVPDPKSFRVSTIVTQTGFPHPSQYAGWALSNAVIPANPLRTDLLSHFQAIFKIKKLVAADLLPGERLNVKGKELLKVKKETFNDHAETLIDLHHRLSRTILNVAPYSKKPSSQNIIDTFYVQVHSHPSPFDFLSQTHHLINKYFIEYPYEKLVQEWHDLENPALHEGGGKELFKATSAILDEAFAMSCEEVAAHLEEPQTKVELATLNFILLQGQLLGRGATALLLQHFSEKIGYPPPLLKNFELLMQTSGLKQVLAFQKELELALPPQIDEKKQVLFEKMQRYLKEEIALFRDEGEYEEPTAKIAHELERYFNSRYTYQRHFSKD